MKPIWLLLFVIQAVLGARVLLRMLRTAGGKVVTRSDAPGSGDETISVIVPVLNERARLAPCLDGLIGQHAEVIEILVVDGGSEDGTQELVRSYATRDSRIQLLDASPVPAGWNGKAWGLHCGVEQSNSANRWMLTIDADVRPEPALARSLLTFANRQQLTALSAATRQELAGVGAGLVHPSLLTTLVYRFGIPGHAVKRVDQVQANGQCFLVRRDILRASGGFTAAADSICEDVTVARQIAALGHAVGFFETEDLVTTRMYDNWRETWRNWPRSLPMRDRYFGFPGVIGLLEVLFVQALPLPLFLALRGRPQAPAVVVWLNGLFAATRFGVLFGTARAYSWRPWTYWLSPLLDMPSAIRLISSALRREHVWRGRVLVRGGGV
jgi:dolichol-phosphate mannosyltransferase